MKAAEIEKRFKAGEEIIRQFPIRISSPTRISMSGEKIHEAQLKKLLKDNKHTITIDSSGVTKHIYKYVAP